MSGYSNDRANQFPGREDESLAVPSLKEETFLPEALPGPSIPVCDLNTYEFELTSDHRPAHMLDEFFEVLRTTTMLKTFKTTLRFEENNFIQLCDAIKLNKSIKVMQIMISSPTNAEKYLPILVKALNKTMKRFEIVLDIRPRDDPDRIYTKVSVTDLLKHLKGLRSPTKSFKLIINDKDMEGQTTDYYRNHIELLSTTNIDNISWDVVVLFGTPFAHPTGFKEFSDYLVKSNNVKSLCIDYELQESHTEILTKVTSLTNLTFYVASYEQALRTKLSESLRKCYIYINGEPADVDTDRPAKYEHQRIIGETVLRNKKLQNSRVNALITVLFNIARDTSGTIPRDIWTLIMSFVTIPGVSLDFGAIARSIFKDSTLRRVIYKRVKMYKYTQS